MRVLLTCAFVMLWCTALSSSSFLEQKREFAHLSKSARFSSTIQKSHLIVPESNFIIEDGPIIASIGYREYCDRSPHECVETGVASKYEYSWDDLFLVNRYVNRLVEQKDDLIIYNADDYWAIPEKTTNYYGDCEDIVLFKRKLLHEAGWALSHLSVTIVRFPNSGDQHAVLTVHTNRGDFILDSIERDIKLWNETEYIFLAKQSFRNLSEWVNINDPRSVQTLTSEKEGM